MLTEERKNELDFYLRNNYTILFAGGKTDTEKDLYGIIDDVYTLSELVQEGYFRIHEYDYFNKIVSITPYKEMKLFNGERTLSVEPFQIADIILDHATNIMFAKEVYGEVYGDDINELIKKYE